MVTKEDLKRKVIEAIEKRAGELQEIGEAILHHPEGTETIFQKKN